MMAIESTWPPRGYDTQPTMTGVLLVCLDCGACVGWAEWAREKHDAYHQAERLLATELANFAELVASAFKAAEVES